MLVGDSSLQPIVTVRQPLERAVINDAEFPRNPAPVELVALRSRVRAFLQNINFTPGVSVKQSNLRFVTKPEPYHVTVDQAKAEGIV